jgi:hypothetical protein
MKVRAISGSLRRGAAAVLAWLERRADRRGADPGY